MDVAYGDTAFTIAAMNAKDSDGGLLINNIEDERMDVLDSCG